MFTREHGSIQIRQLVYVLLIVLAGLSAAAIIWRVNADSPHTGLDFSIAVDVDGDTTYDCNTTGGPPMCFVPPASTFQLDVLLNDTGGVAWEGYEVHVLYSGVISKDNEANTPSCDSEGAPYGPGEVRWACGLAAPSTYTGLISTVDFNCTSHVGSITLVHGTNDTFLNDADRHTEGEGNTESLGINCFMPITPGFDTPTPTPTASLTPTPTPTSTDPTPNPAKCGDPTKAGRLHIFAEIDGRSRLTIQGNNVQWQHFDEAAPGRLNLHEFPTFVNCVEWFPEWPDIPTTENRDCGGCVSSLYHAMPPLPDLADFLGISPTNNGCRKSCEVVEAPSEANGQKLVIEFNDNSVDGSYWYELHIKFIPPIPHHGNIFPVASGGPSPLSSPAGVVEAPDGSIYVSDSSACHVIRLQANGVHTTVAGQAGPCGYSGDGTQATNAQLNAPLGLAVDSPGRLYIADSLNSRIRRVEPGFDGVVNGVGLETISTVAGNGSTDYSICTDGTPATGPCLSTATGVWADAVGGFYISNLEHRVQYVDTGSAITTVAGDGTPGLCADGGAATGPCLSGAWDLVGDNAGTIYISNRDSHTVAAINAGVITTAAGNGTPGTCPDGNPATGPCLDGPAGLDLNAGNLYVASAGSHLVHRVGGGIIHTEAGGGVPSPGYCGDFGVAASACLDTPLGLDVAAGNQVYFADAGNARLRLVYSTTIDTMLGPDYCGETRVAVSSSCLDNGSDVSLDIPGNIYMADPQNHRVRMVDVDDAHIYPLAGKTEQTNCAGDGGAAANLCLANARELVVSPDNNRLYISDRDGNRIWRINLNTGQVRRIAGAADGTAGICPDDTDSRDPSGCLNRPRGLDLRQTAGGTDQYLYVAQEGSAQVARIDLINETIRMVHGDGERPTDASLAPDGSLFVAEPSAHVIVRVDPGLNGIVEGQAFDPTESSTIVIGNGSVGLPTDGMAATDAPLNTPGSVEADADGHILFSDAGNNTIWVVKKDRIYRIAGSELGIPGFCGDPNPDPHPAREACLNSPSGIFYHDLGTTTDQQLSLYFADEGNDRVRKIPSDCDGDGLLDREEANLTWKGGTVVTNECADDTDGDGCTDAQEVGPSQHQGGRRNPTDGNDYFNPTGDRQNRVDDILMVVMQYFMDDNDGNPGLPPYVPGYNPNTDRRNQGAFPNPWNTAAPDGVQRVQDIVYSVNSYFHDCV